MGTKRLFYENRIRKNHRLRKSLAGIVAALALVAGVALITQKRMSR